jgi:hypothetical protein
MKVARAWSGLLYGTWEPVAPRSWLAGGACVGPKLIAEARTSSSGNCKGGPGRRGGPSRSSGEGSVKGAGAKGRVVLACLAVNHVWAGGTG